VAGLIEGAIIVGATIGAVVVPFVLVPEILERIGYNSRSGFVRSIVWATFLAIVLVPAAASGFLLSVRAVDWAIFAVAMVVAILYDYYRLNPGRLPWSRSNSDR